MIDRYVITIKNKTAASVLVGYQDGVCVLVEIKTDGLTPEQTGWILKTVPAYEAELTTFELSTPYIKVEPVPTDLSFNIFWETYGYKVGKRERAMKLWAGMDEAQKTKCLRSIPRYNQWLTLKFNMERLYPETYLSQKRYDNEFKI